VIVIIISEIIIIEAKELSDNTKLIFTGTVVKYCRL